MTAINFCQFTLSGVDAEKFLQGQLTANTIKLTDRFIPTAICNLKGRVEFGIWLKKLGEQDFAIVISKDCADNFTKHIKKYGAFSKMTLSPAEPIFAIIDNGRENGEPTFSKAAQINDENWQKRSIEQGNYWITQITQGLFQPQELRLHQRGGVDYDKGCYLGQEIIARLWFKASPKAWLHRVSGTGDVPNAGEKLGKIDVVNSVAIDNGFEALVIARPDDISEAGLNVLDLPAALQLSVAREK